MSKESKEIIKRSDEVNSLLVAYANEIEDEKMFRSDCKLCNCEYRAEVETKFEETDSIKAAHNVLVNKGIKDITYFAVRRHLLNHFVVQERKMMLKEYANKINEFMAQNYNRQQQLLERAAILQNKIYTIEVLAEGQDLKSTMASADAIKKICDTLLLVEKELDIIKGDLKPAEIIVNNLKTIISEEMNSTQNQEIRNVLIRVFDKLINNIKNIEIEKE